MVEGLGSEVLPQPYHMPAMPTPRRSLAPLRPLNCFDFGAGRRQCGRKASRQARMPTPAPSTWPVTVG